MIRITKLFCLAFIALLALSCSNKHKFDVAVGPQKRAGEYTKLDKIYKKYSQKIGKKYKIKLFSDSTFQFSSNIKFLRDSNFYDMAVVNNMVYPIKDSSKDEYANIRAIMPVSSRILYIAYNRQTGEPKSLEELLLTKRVVILSNEISFIKNILNNFGIDSQKINFLLSRFHVDDPDLAKLDKKTRDSIMKVDYMNAFKSKEPLPYDVEIGLIPTSFGYKSRLYRLLNSHKEFELYSLDDYKMFNNGSFVEGFCLRDKSFTPYLLPKGTYGEFPENPVLTLRQDFILIGRADIDEEFVYEFVKTAVEETDLLDLNTYGKNFSNITFTIPLHEGTRRYLDKNAPKFYEKYGEMMGKIGTGVGGFYTALMGFMLWRKRRRRMDMNKDYQKVLNWQADLHNADDIAALTAFYGELQNLQELYHKKVLERKILIDETLKIFFDLLNKNEQYILEKIDRLKK